MKIMSVVVEQMLLCPAVSKLCSRNSVQSKQTLCAIINVSIYSFE